MMLTNNRNMDLDENDVNILNVLLQNGRLSYRQISEKVKVSVPTVSSKISALEERGVILGYKAIIDPEKLGEFSAVIQIDIRPSDVQSVSGHFTNGEYIRMSYVLSSGKILLICTFSNMSSMNDLILKTKERS